MLRSFWVIVVLTVATATAWAQPAPRPTVEAAQGTVRAAEQKQGRLLDERRQITRRYQEQLSAIDRLKKQKPSWRRDRELNAVQADANDTAKKLTVIDNQLRVVQQELARALAGVVAAIDAELPNARGARAEQLSKLRARLAPAVPAPKKIVIPDAEIDPLADPEELERQAAAIAAAEKLLEAQRRGLDQQHKDLQHVAEIRSAHDRAGELSIRDDDQPRHGAPRGGSRNTAASDDAAAPQAGGSEGAGGGGGGGGAGGDFNEVGDRGSSSFESSAAVALGEVIDKSTIDGLLRASRSGNPKQRAEAAKNARDAVAKRLEQLRKQRERIEQRAKQLRKR